MADILYFDRQSEGDGTVTPEEVDMKATARIEKLEAVFAERFEGINGRLKRIESIFIGAAGAIILLLINIVLEMSR